MLCFPVWGFFLSEKRRKKKKDDERGGQRTDLVEASTSAGMADEDLDGCGGASHEMKVATFGVHTKPRGDQRRGTRSHLHLQISACLVVLHRILHGL